MNEGSKERRETSSYYTYHWDKGHIIDNYSSLNDKVQKLIQRGFPKEFVTTQKMGMWNWKNGLQLKEKSRFKI